MTPKDEPTVTQEIVTTRVAELLRIAIWPVIFVIVYAMNYRAFTDAIALIPAKLAESTKISVAGFVVEIEKAARATEKTNLLPGIRSLSSAAVAALLQTPRDSSARLVAVVPAQQEGTLFVIPQDLTAMEELVNAGYMYLYSRSDEPIREGTLAVAQMSLAELLSIAVSRNREDARAELDRRRMGSLISAMDRETSLKVLEDVRSPPFKQRWPKNFTQRGPVPWVLPTSDYSKHLHLQRIEYGLTGDGKQVFDLIVKVVSEQLPRSEQFTPNR